VSTELDPDDLAGTRPELRDLLLEARVIAHRRLVGERTAQTPDHAVTVDAAWLLRLTDATEALWRDLIDSDRMCTALLHG
jgi:hypothetical protein